MTTHLKHTAKLKVTIVLQIKKVKIIEREAPLSSISDWDEGWCGLFVGSSVNVEVELDGTKTPDSQ